MLYVFIIAVLNLGLGFLAAVHLRRSYNRPAAASVLRENVPRATQSAGPASLDADQREDRSDDANELVGAGAAKHSTVDGNFSTDLDALFQ